MYGIKFIRVHTVNKTVLINVNYIVSIFDDSYRSSKGGKIVFHDNEVLSIKETRDDILKLIYED